VTVMKKPWQRTGRVFFITALLLSATLSHAQTLILDQGVGTQVGSYTIPRIWDPETRYPVSVFGGTLLSMDRNGNRTPVSDLGSSIQGPISSGYLNAVSTIPSGLLGLGRTILALDPFAGINQGGALFAIDPSTGRRRMVSDFGNSNQGLPLGVTLRGVVASPGVLGLGSEIYVIDSNAGTNGHGLLTRIDPITGHRTVLSDFGNSAQGPIGNNPSSIALAPPGIFGLFPTLLVLDTDMGTDRVGVLFTVDLLGNRTVLSDLGASDQGQTGGVAPQKVAIFPGGHGLSAAIYVIDYAAGSNGEGALFQIDASSGNRTLISNFGDSTKGPGDDPVEIAATEFGDLLVFDDMINQDRQPQILLVDRLTGQRTVASECSNTALGPCSHPVGLTQLP